MFLFLSSIIILCILIISFEFIRVRKIFYLDFCRGFSLVYMLMYVIVPIVLTFFEPNFRSSGYWGYFSPFRDMYFSTIAILIAIIGYFSYVIGYRLRKENIKKILIKLSIHINDINIKYVLYISSFLCFLSILFFFLYVRKMNSDIFTLIIWAGLLRTGEVNFFEKSSYTLLKLSMFNIPLSLIFLGLIREVRNYWMKMSSFLLFIISLIFSIVSLFILAGRLHLGIYIFSLFINLNYLLYKKKRSFYSKILYFLILFVAIIVIFYIVLYGKYLLGVTLQAPKHDNIFEMLRSLILEFSFPYLSLVNTIYKLKTLNELRYFIDFPLTFIYMFAGYLYKLLGLKIPIYNASLQNTEYFVGKVDEDFIPADMLTTGYLNCGIFGVTIFGFLWGFVFNLFDYLFKNVKINVYKYWKTLALTFMITMGTMYGDPYNIINDGMYIFLPVFVILIFQLYMKLILKNKKVIL